MNCEMRAGGSDVPHPGHALCLSEHLEDPYFEWLHWLHSLLPFSDDELPRGRAVEREGGGAVLCVVVAAAVGDARRTRGREEGEERG